MKDPYWQFESTGEQDTQRLGTALATALPDGSVVGLIGTLGAGKTRLVQAVAEACGVDVRNVVSPTYVVLHEYQGQRPIYHFDLYRLKDEDEFDELGADEYFEQPGLTFLEWSDRFADCLPAERLDIKIDIVSQSKRMFRFIPSSPQMETAIGQLRQRLQSP
ncbi:MAG: tRNA (adenosine(37)-N6)-threonylcarbamoyltransferase complex ATPase subunit type 1 TsaE [Planctomycetales bacterium]